MIYLRRFGQIQHTVDIWLQRPVAKGKKIDHLS